MTFDLLSGTRVSVNLFVSSRTRMSQRSFRPVPSRRSGGDVSASRVFRLSSLSVLRSWCAWFRFRASELGGLWALGFSGC